MTGVFQTLVNHRREFAVLFRVSRVEIVKVDEKISEIRRMLQLNVVDQLLGGNAFLLGAQHDGRTVGIVGANINSLMAAQLLETHPDVGLYVLKHVPQMDRTVGVGQGAGNEDLARWGNAGHGVSASVG